MKKMLSRCLLFFILHTASCRTPATKNQEGEMLPVFKEGEFGYDLAFLKKQDSGLVVLKDGEAQVIVSARYQAKVFTSTAAGMSGLSFGWINYKAFTNPPDAHMNAYGGENRLWLGPEGGLFSLFFPPGSKMIFDNWKTPAAIDTENWNILKNDSHSVEMYKEMKLVNYQGTLLSLSVNRTTTILNQQEIIGRTGISGNSLVDVVGYETNNLLTNKGGQEWTTTSGMPCIWILDMFKPTPETFIVLPFKYSAGEDLSRIANTGYFGQIPADRIKHRDSLLVFKADGKSRGKLGIGPAKAKNRAGSYDVYNKVLTIIFFDVDEKARYLNQEWSLEKPVFSGDAVNAYNDGPLADGTQMGPFYEIESVSPAAFLKPGESLIHKHSVFHFTGEEKDINEMAVHLLGISLENMKRTFVNE